MQAIFLLAGLAGLIYIFFWFSKRNISQAKPKVNSISSLEDAYEGSFINDAIEPTAARLYLAIEYVDANGERTHREIEVNEFDKRKGTKSSKLLRAYCKMRGAWRTFRYDRIVSAIDLETGEIISDVQERLTGVQQDTKITKTSHDNKNYTFIEILVFIGRADGRLIARERDVIATFLNQTELFSLKSNEELDLLIKNTRKITTLEFRSAIQMLRGEEDNIIQSLITCADDILKTQNAVHPAETEAFTFLKSELLK